MYWFLRVQAVGRALTTIVILESHGMYFLYYVNTTLRKNIGHYITEFPRVKTLQCKRCLGTTVNFVTMSFSTSKQSHFGL